MAYRHGLLIGRMIHGGKAPEVWELFPFWTEQEQNELRMQRIETMLRGMGAREAKANG